MNVLTAEEAMRLFKKLPAERQIATLSPEYVITDNYRDSSVESYFLSYERGDYFWLHSLLKGRVPETDFFDFQSPYGYGGPVSNTDDVAFHCEAWENYTAWCKRHKIIAEFVRLHPLGQQTYLGEVTLNRDVVFLNPDDTITPGFMNSVRKAQGSGVTCYANEKANIGGFGKGYRAAMRKIGATDFYFFGNEYFDSLIESESAYTVVAEHPDLGIVASALFLEGEAAIEYHLSYNSDDGRKCAAMNMILWHVHRGADARRKKLYLGGGKTVSRNDPLLAFKRSMGGQEMPYYTGYAIHMPDTYYAMEEAAHEVGAVNPRILFWRK